MLGRIGMGEETQKVIDNALRFEARLASHILSYEEDGNLADWWEPDDYRIFAERTQKLIGWYDRVTVFDDGTPYSGTMVQTEAIADMAGMKCILKMAEKIENFDYDRFFRANAAM